jgi:putative addiction module killer protein
VVEARYYVAEDGRSPFAEWFGALDINFGPGYRLYSGRDGDAVVILLIGGTKKRQQRDTAAAIPMWASYKRRKRRT